MAGPGIHFTPNLHLSLLPSNYRVWTQQMNDNLSLLDAAISGFIKFNNLRGVWQNSTVYAIGDTVSDGETAVLYSSSEAHTSPTIPTTFEEDRLANPERWAVTGRAASNRGAWTPATSYLINDFVLADGTKYAMCLIAHTSGGTFAADLALGRWAVMIDLSAVGSLVLPVLSGAPDANKYTGTNAAGTSYVNFDGAEAMARLSGVLNVARGGTGVQNFTGTGTNFVKDTDPLFKNSINLNANANTSLVVEAFNNSSTGATAQTIKQMGVGGKLVSRVLDFTGAYLREFGTLITTRLSDFDTQLFRKNDGTPQALLDGGTLSVYGPNGVSRLALTHDNAHAHVGPVNATSRLFLVANNVDALQVLDSGLYPITANASLLGNSGVPFAQVHTYFGMYYGATSGSITVNAPAVAGANTITWPAASGVVALVNAGATATFFTGGSPGTVNFVTQNVFVNGPTTGVIGAAGQKWFVTGTMILHGVNPGVYFYESHIFDGSVAVSQLITTLANGNQSCVSPQNIFTLTGPTTFTLRAACLSAAAGGDINGASSITAIRLA